MFKKREEEAMAQIKYKIINYFKLKGKTAVPAITNEPLEGWGLNTTISL